MLRTASSLPLTGLLTLGSDAGRVNGQVFVPGGGQVKVPTPRVDQILFRVVPPLARASRMR
jgi:hypothetical protein